MLFWREKKENLYRVILEGGNLHLSESGVSANREGVDDSCNITMGIKGFFTTRCVKAFSEDDAIAKAIEAVEEELVEKKLSKNKLDDPPYIMVYDIEKISVVRSLFIPSRGFTFFPYEKDTKKPSNGVDLLTK